MFNEATCSWRDKLIVLLILTILFANYKYYPRKEPLEGVLEKRCFEMWVKNLQNIPVKSSFFYKAAGCRPATLLKTNYFTDIFQGFWSHVYLVTYKNTYFSEVSFMEHFQWLLVYLKQISEGNILYKRQLSLNYVFYLTIIDLICNETTENKLKTKQE